MLRRHILPTAAIIAFLAAGATHASAQTIEDDLRLLDSTLEMADEYYKNKETLITSLESLLNYPNTSSDQKFTIYGQIYNENFSYSFDKALAAINNQENIAKSLGEKYLHQVRLEKAMLFTTAGLYMEAKDILDTQIDTTKLSSEQTLDYYYVMQRFWKDYKEYSDGKQISGEPIPSRYTYFRERYIEESDESDFRHKQLVIFNLMEERNNEEADRLNRQLLSELDPLSHEYAIMAYYQAVIKEYQGLRAERLHWLITSSIVDTKNAVRDYASLSSIATDILDSDVDRASRYIQRSLEDAMFYNAKLRPWQIARLLPDIDNAYRQKQEKVQHKASKSIVYLAVLSLLFCLAVIVLGLLMRKQSEDKKALHKDLESSRRHSEDLEQRNAHITEAFGKLSDQDKVKRDQFVALLEASNSYLDKAKKNLSPEQREAELKQYYSTFDSAFIQMYPTFVEDFNALLKPEARIELKKDDLLNTELRIFALIKLGVVQSSSIASLLRYSVNTIYNYRAQIKNAALNEREDFEKNVKNIGKVDF